MEWALFAGVFVGVGFVVFFITGVWEAVLSIDEVSEEIFTLEDEDGY
jgi:hypothetical protein